MATLAERFRAKVQTDSLTACWLWTGARSANGYGLIRFGRGVLYAHRVSYELHVGPIPYELVIDHTCGTRACVNPRHLEPVTQATNILRGWLVGAQREARARRRRARLLAEIAHYDRLITEISA